MSDRLLRALRWLLPSAWRAAVARDLEDEARAQGRGALWVAWQTLRVGTRLRVTFGAGALWFDLRYAIRSLIRAPWFTAGAVLTFALGIGVNIAVFAVIDRVMFRPLPYAEPERLVQIHSTYYVGTPSAPSGAVTQLKIADEKASAIRTRAHSFESVVVASTYPVTEVVRHLGDLPLRMVTMSPEEFALLGVRPIAGRPFTSSRLRREYELLITFELWRSRFGGSREPLDRLYGEPDWPYRIVGVLPPGFLPPNSAATERIDAVRATAVDGLSMGGGIIQPLIARLRPGATIVQARAEVAALAGADVQVHPLQTGLFLVLRSYLWLIVLAVALVWLVAAVNLTILLLARGQARADEQGIRLALGAPAGRVVWSALLEAMLVCMGGAGLALLVCQLAGPITLAIVPVVFRPFAVDVLDVRLLTLTFAATAGSALAAGALPARRRARVDPLETLRGRASSTSTPRLRGAATLMMLQAALGLVLTAGAAMTTRSFSGLVFGDPGFVPADLFLVTVGHGYPDGPLRQPPALSRVETIQRVASAWPNVRSVAIATSLPVGFGFGGVDHFWKTMGVTGRQMGVGANMLATLGTALIAGREFTPVEVARRERVAVLTASGANVLWPGSDLQSIPGRELTILGGRWTVVGVAADIRQTPVFSPQPTLFLPLTTEEARRSSSNLYLAVRMASGVLSDDELWTKTLNDAFGSRNGASAEPVLDYLVPWLQQPRFYAALFGTLGLVALILTAAGVYAVAAFDVSQRRREMGIRLTLGASGGDLVRAICRRALRPIIGGIVAGLIGAWWGGQFLQAFLVDVDVHDPWTQAAVVLVLVLTALAAAWLPALRAGRVNPVDTLRAT